MAKHTTRTPKKRGTFSKGRSGNPKGRPKGSTNHEKELRQAEDRAMELAVFICDVIKETARLAFTKVGNQEVVMPLIEVITDTIKEQAREGEIGPSSIGILRDWYEDHAEDDEGAFFKHAGLPPDCSWEAFRKHYTKRKRIDHDHHADDLFSFPPIAARIKELKELTT